MNIQSTTKRIWVMAIAMLVCTTINAQEKKASPPKTSTANIGGNMITIQYSSPSVKGRTIWGDLVPYDKVWRTGANEATTIEVSKDCTIGGKTLKAGKYGLFTIPTTDDWTIIINSVANQWGAYEYDKSKDVLRFTATPTEVDQSEMFTISIDDAGQGAIVWDTLSVPFVIK